MKYYFMIIVSLGLLSCKRQVLFQANREIQLERKAYDSIHVKHVIQPDEASLVKSAPDG
jgi:hypothetical protein